MSDAYSIARFELKIDGIDLATIPMDKIGQIMRQFAGLTDHKKNVFLEAVADGCVSMTCRVDGGAIDAVQARIVEAGRTDGGGPRAAWQEMDDTIASVGGVGKLRDVSRDIVVLSFPGASVQRAAAEPMWQTGTLRGRLISLRLTNEGPKGTLSNAGGREPFEATRAHADELRGALFEAVELIGRGQWLREDAGQWRLLRFEASGHRVLDDSGLLNLRARLVAAGGFGSASPDQVRRELDALR